MGIGTSVFLIAVGAILDFAVDVTVSGINLRAVGVILMVVGAIGLVASLLFWSSWGGFGSYRRRRIVEDGGIPVSRSRRSVYEDEVL